jgi:hypothetical protein
LKAGAVGPALITIQNVYYATATWAVTVVAR